MFPPIMVDFVYHNYGCTLIYRLLSYPWRSLFLQFSFYYAHKCSLLVIRNFYLFILLYKVVRVFCLKLKISITTELIGFSILGKLHIGPVMVLGYCWCGEILFCPLFYLSIPCREKIKCESVVLKGHNYQIREWMEKNWNHCF